MKTLIKTAEFMASPDKVFDTLDNLGVTGMHMTNPSSMMMGNKLQIEYLTAHHTGPGSKYRWTGKMMGMKMDFTVIVSKWIKDMEKIWETVGEAKMILYSWYRMKLVISPAQHKTKAELSITYKKPKGLFCRVLSFLLGGLYGRWCLRRMLGDAKKHMNT